MLGPAPSIREFRQADQRADGVSGSFDALPAALLAVDDCKDTHHCAAFADDGLDGRASD